jgi:hypothetical protein
MGLTVLLYQRHKDMLLLFLPRILIQVQVMVVMVVMVVEEEVIIPITIPAQVRVGQKRM